MNCDLIPNLFPTMDYILIEDYVKNPDYLIEFINNSMRKKKTKQYGFNYDVITNSMTIADLIPEELKLINDHYNHVLINVYDKNHNTKYIHSKKFDNRVFIISLLSDSIIVFTKEGESDRRILIKKNSLFILYGWLRDSWEYHMDKETNFEWEGKKYIRDKRITITYRNYFMW